MLGDEGGGAVHVLPYEIKRAHWGMTGWARERFLLSAEELKAFCLRDMTAARYDIMMVMMQRPRWLPVRDHEVYEMHFSMLVRKLGLDPSTISKCLKRLVELKWVTRHVDETDRRRCLFRLTWQGEYAIGMARAVLFGALDEAFFTANEAFAQGAAWDETRLRRWVGEHHEDNMLIGFGQRVRQCAQVHGSRAWPIYDPDFDDDQLARRFAGAA